MIEKREYRRKKIFAASDIHGHLDELIAALKEANFDPECDDHLLVLLGDCFDRGRQNKATYSYLKSVKNKLLLMGNHEDILKRALVSGLLTDIQENNGTTETLREFFPNYSGGPYLPINRGEEPDIRTELLGFINSLGCYYESEHYIFTHGWLPVLDDGSVPEDWRCADSDTWYRARWHRWKDFYGISRIPEGKTLVIGHTPVMYYARGFDPSRDSCSSVPFFGEQMIAIDASTVHSGRVNVLVLDDRVPEPVELSLEVSLSVYGALSEDGASAFIIPYDPSSDVPICGDRLILTCEGGEALSRTVVSSHRYNSLDTVEDYFTPEELGLSSDMTLRALYSGQISVDSPDSVSCLVLRIS